ncbi:MAG: ATP-grasp domain-containing protein, partial [Hyphomicrobiaceae bacterium]
AHAKDPLRLTALLRDLGIAAPETSIAPPPDGRGWLSKRIGGSGGGHVAICRSAVKGQSGRYYQRRIDGELISMLGVMRGRRAAFAFTTQWCNPMPRRPFRFGGIAGPLDIDPDLEARLIDIGLDVGAALGLVGLVSFDFVVADGEPHLVDVNPRPSASLDVLDDAEGTLFKAHVAACAGDDPAAMLARDWRPRRAAAMRYVYADAGDVIAPALDWPQWTSDRPLHATHIRRYQPVATVHAAGATLADVMSSLEERTHELEGLLYLP